jgi:transcriptional regulator with XRE-family HTH domain
MSDERTPPRGRLREHVAEEIRVLLARKRMSGAELGRRAGIKQSAISRRITGEVAFDMDDLEAIADVLGVDVADLLPRTVGALKEGLGGPISSVALPHPKILSRRRTVRTPAPVSHGRRDATRPVSAVPANRRRPTVVGLGKRPMPR